VGLSAIETAASNLDVRKIHDWLRSKLPAASVVETDALTLLRNAVEKVNDYLPALLGHLDAAILDLVRLTALRRTGSHGELLGETKARADKHLTAAMNTLEGMKQWS